MMRLLFSILAPSMLIAPTLLNAQARSAQIYRNGAQHQTMPQAPWEQDDQHNKALVLGTIMEIVGHFFNILQAPHNSSNVAKNVGDIVSNIGNAVANFKSPQSIDLDMNSEEFKQQLIMRMKLLKSMLRSRLAKSNAR